MVYSPSWVPPRMLWSLRSTAGWCPGSLWTEDRTRSLVPPRVAWWSSPEPSHSAGHWSHPHSHCPPTINGLIDYYPVLQYQYIQMKYIYLPKHTLSNFHPSMSTMYFLLYTCSSTFPFWQISYPPFLSPKFPIPISDWKKGSHGCDKSKFIIIACKGSIITIWVP